MTALTNLTSDWLCSVTKRRKMAATRVKRFDLLEAVTVQVNSTHSSHLRWQWCWSWSRCKWWQFEKLFLLLVSFLGGLCWTKCYWAILQLNRKDLFSVHYQMIFVFNQFHICKVQRNENCRCKYALLIFSTRNEYQETWAAAYFALSSAQYYSCHIMSKRKLPCDKVQCNVPSECVKHVDSLKCIEVFPKRHCYTGRAFSVNPPLLPDQGTTVGVSCCSWVTNRISNSLLFASFLCSFNATAIMVFVFN